MPFTKKYLFSLLFLFFFNLPVIICQDIQISDDVIHSSGYAQKNILNVKYNDQLELNLMKDSIVRKQHSPRKAAWMSAVLPGLGQVYNKKYWKVPVIYVGFGVIGFLGYDYYNKFNKYKQTYLYRTGINADAHDYFPYIQSKDVLYENWNFYRRNFELTCIFGSLLYVLNIIDASVDAHLYQFDISDDLSLRIEPELNRYNELYGYNSNSAGVKFTIKF